MRIAMRIASDCRLPLIGDDSLFANRSPPVALNCKGRDTHPQQSRLKGTRKIHLKLDTVGGAAGPLEFFQ